MNGKPDYLASRFFARGKQACAEQQPRDLVDARVSDENRRAFQAGWDEQAELMRPRTAEEIAQANANIARLKKELREKLGIEA